MDIWDYIIVGAGSAGSVLAERLSADGRARVLVLEAGGTDRRPEIRVPIGYGLTFHGNAVNWRMQSEPDPGLDGRQMYWPRGKVVGGSSSINAMVYARGLPGDYDDWETAGNPGWGAAEVAQVYARVEHRVHADGRSTGDGPLWVSDRSREYHPLGRHYLQAIREAGLPEGDTVAGEGAGPYQLTTRKGWRHSAADAFLRPALHRRNLKLVTGAEVLGLTFDGLRASGVRYRRGGQTLTATCRGEVILSAGAVKSPQLLQLSGIGPGDLLQRMGIPVLIDAPGVGGALQDHLAVTYTFRCEEPTLNQVLGRRIGQVMAAIRYALFRDGPFSLSVNQMGGLVRSRPGLPQADMQLYFNPLSYSTVHRNRRPLLKPDPWPGFILSFNPCRPTSRGRIDIISPDPSAQPGITPNSLSTQGDVADMIAGGRLIERLLDTPALRKLATAAHGFTPQGQTDEAILADARARAGTVYHPTCTCRMAPREAGGVVGPTLKVHSAEGLRVVDASIFPNITSANTNAPTIMAAMRAADLILAGA
ncbi:GMC family oxidoreductase N-terminal domain-containing protein [Roseicyclus persicicus]|uniref:Choline dehydrogenase n=1 Tax=Roseicyclus persicicus TaxID=2650661 RepID=A0A7X6JXL9_9RHOB|nr:choline dehydrogenase [Roseibacterium persicicum]